MRPIESSAFNISAVTSINSIIKGHLSHCLQWPIVKLAISLGQRDMVALYINYVLITFHKKGSIKVVIFKWNNCRLWELFLGSPTSTLVGGIGWLAPHRRQLRTCAMCILWEGEGVTWVTQVPRPTWQLPVENSLGRLQTKTPDGQGHDFSLLGF